MLHRREWFRGRGACRLPAARAAAQQAGGRTEASRCRAQAGCPCCLCGVVAISVLDSLRDRPIHSTRTPVLILTISRATRNAFRVVLCGGFGRARGHRFATAAWSGLKTASSVDFRSWAGDLAWGT